MFKGQCSINYAWTRGHFWGVSNHPSNPLRLQMLSQSSISRGSPNALRLSVGSSESDGFFFPPLWTEQFYCENCKHFKINHSPIMPYYSLYISKEKKLELNFTLLRVKIMRQKMKDAELLLNTAGFSNVFEGPRHSVWSLTLLILGSFLDSGRSHVT